MKDHKTAHYTTSIEVTKSPEVIFDHLLHHVAKFWPEDFEGKSAALNDEFIFTSGGDSHYSKNKVIELIANKKVVWLVTESIRKTDNFDWTGTKMIFELTPKGSHTHIEFTYDGIILEGEHDRLVQICDLVIKEMLYNFISSTK